MNQSPATAPSGRLLCIGDIHGCARELRALLVAVAPVAGDRVVFLGDYVDRGPDSRDVLDALLEVREALPDTVFLRGNHEEMFLSYLGLGGDRGEIFLAAGGAATVRSYGLPARSRSGPPGDEVRRAMPEAHVEFLQETRPGAWEVGGFTFVHAGVRPGVPLEDQSAADLLWIRDDFLPGRHGLETTVVFGHTPQRDVWISRDAKIGLDTGCVYGGRLSCLDLRSGRIHQVARDAAEATVSDVGAQLHRVGILDIDEARC